MWNAANMLIGVLLLLFFFSMFGLAAAPLSTGDLLWSWHGGSSDLFGSTVAVIGDADRDGYEDVLVGAPGTILAGHGPPGSAALYSGRSGLVLGNLTGRQNEDQFGSAVAGMGDLNGDGMPEVVVGADQADGRSAEDRGVVSLLSGRTGEVMQILAGEEGANFGHAIAATDDADSDGIPDVLAGAPLFDGTGGEAAGMAGLYSGQTGSLLHRWEGQAPYALLGVAVAGVGDLDRDGGGDILIGATGHRNGEGETVGGAFAYSGRTGEVIWSWEGRRNSQFGFALTEAGDLDQDGVAEVAVGAPNSGGSTSESTGAVFVYAGATGELLRSWTGEGPFDQFGSSLAGGRDVNGDGMPDLIVGAPGYDGAHGEEENQGKVYVYSGVTGRLLSAWVGREETEQFGSSVASGDVSRDSFADVVVGAPSAETESGRVDIYSGGPSFQLDAAALIPGDKTDLVATMGIAAGETVVFLASLRGPGPSTHQRFGSLLLDPPVLVLGSARADENGSARLTIPVPAAIPLGRPVYFQAVTERDARMIHSELYEGVVVSSGE